MKAIILLADGFETVEALQTYDVLKRAKQFDVRLVSISSSLEVHSSIGVAVKAEKLIDEIHPEEEDMLILPGGKLGVENLSRSEKVIQMIHDFFRLGKDVHAICAAPSILGSLGYLDELSYTCFPGFQVGNGLWQDQGVVITDHIITGRSMGYTLEFAEAIVRHYFYEPGFDIIRPGIYGLQ